MTNVDPPTPDSHESDPPPVEPGSRGKLVYNKETQTIRGTAPADMLGKIAYQKYSGGISDDELQFDWEHMSSEKKGRFVGVGIAVRDAIVNAVKSQPAPAQPDARRLAAEKIEAEMARVLASQSQEDTERPVRDVVFEVLAKFFPAPPPSSDPRWRELRKVAEAANDDLIHLHPEDVIKFDELTRPEQILLLLDALATAERERDDWKRRAVKAELEGGWRVDPQAYISREEHQQILAAAEAKAERMEKFKAFVEEGIDEMAKGDLGLEAFLHGVLNALTTAGKDGG